MEKRNMSDIIEAYLKQVLQRDEQVEIRRSEIADRFECVPSQINYVINTRFTPQNGYVVESKRGGGGYIRIVKLEITDAADYIDTMLNSIKASITLREATAILASLIEAQIISKKEGHIIHSAIDRDALYEFDDKNKARALILTNILTKLKYQ
ncbi:CtsR family transcriptional regulator [Aerococcus urinaehominis]|uniref:Transcriptional regulator CtsR n=1 Tax=Aerococcus urinaehominis TaxID=128944 RepID=A0A120IAV4_9LACT|nr:CtsR family transcriptional regulator [Aerococcus urinaehominis]AMB99248.1 CtsR family transcriptional regulator [Aerococcus urinaehominis]SDM31115.1 transcriptional regulator CtsR [Aerococcus urinaehominis]